VDKDPLPQLTDTNPLFHSALQEQAAIGWPQLLQGRWSKQWQLIHMQTHTTPANSRKKPEHWSHAILKTVWENCFNMWQNRKKDRHGHDAATAAAAEREQLQREMTQLYGWQPFLAKHKQHIFQIPLHEMIQKPTSSLHNWIQLWKEHILDEASDSE
jgi:hypothetical protein